MNRILRLCLALLIGACTRRLPATSEATEVHPTQPPPTGAPMATSGPQEGSDPIVALEGELGRHAFVYSDEGMTEVALAIMLEVNAARQMNGVQHLRAASPLMHLAALRAKEMIALGYFDHVHPRRGTVEADRLLRATGISGGVGELLFESSTSREDLASDAVLAWLEQDANRRTMLSTDYQHIGVGVMGDGERWIVAALMSAEQP